MIDFSTVSKEKPVIAWWSGGITSAVTCHLCIEHFGKENVRVVMIDTNNEDPDTYRFKRDCEKWWGVSVEVISNAEYETIEDVWYKFNSLNVANGAICSAELKRAVRLKFQNLNKYAFQAFGFEVTEVARAKAMQLNYPESKPIFPLIYNLLSKPECVAIVQKAGIEPPLPYAMGYNNNNCFRTGCVQGGIGYWQKMGRDFPEKYKKMADIEHELTNLKGKPVTMLKDQNKKTPGLVFLLPHPDYPLIKDLSQMKGRDPKPLMDCNGFCGTNALGKLNETIHEINYE